MGFASSRSQARQLVCHGHFLVNDHKVDIPSYLIKGGDLVTLREKSRQNGYIQQSMETVARRGVPRWLELDKAAFQGRIKELPVREDLTMPISEQLIVELYSK
jgi:small subunit ribosomal protein S4